MIKVTITQNQVNILKVEIKGHANSNEHGKDLVCAGVSSIGIGILNSINILAKDSCDCKVSDGYILIDVINNNDNLQVILKTLIIQLETIEFNFKKYIKIYKQEV